MKLAGFITTLALTASLASFSLRADVLTDYYQTNLVTSATDPDLINPWGISSSAGSPFWVSDNGTGKSTLYNTAGVKQGLVVSMPNADPITGQVFNGTSSFKGDLFIFASENGTIDGWRGALGTSAETLFTTADSVYKGIAISSTGDTLYAANFESGNIDVFNSAGLTASYADPDIPDGYAPFNIQRLNGVYYVTYAKQDDAKHDDVAGAGNGFVDVFDPVTHTFTRLVSNGDLNSPWGLAVAPGSFGPAANDLLVGNFGDGSINVYDPVTGKFIGTIGNTGSAALVNAGLWGLKFGNGGNGGKLGSLYLTAGGADEGSGLFARIDPIPEPSLTWLIGGGIGLLALVKRRM